MAQLPRPRLRWLIPVVTTLLAFVPLVVVTNNTDDSFAARINPESVTVVDAGLQVSVEWIDRDSRTAMSGVLTISRTLAEATSLRVRMTVSGDLELFSSGFRWPDRPLMIFVGSLGALLGLVIVNSLAGYGYVGDRSSRRSVREGRGFYWRG